MVEEPPEPVKKGKAKVSSAKGKKAVEPEPVPVAAEPKEHTSEQTRWMLQPGEHVPVRCLFRSDEVAERKVKLGFEVYNGDTHTEVVAKGVCDLPRISQDYRNVFSSRRKVKPGKEGDAAVRRLYVINRKRFEFGPLLVGESKEEHAERADNVTTLRITNNGKFDAHVVFSLKSAALPPPEPVEAPKKGKAAGKPAPVPVAPVGPFSLGLETADLKVRRAFSTLGLSSVCRIMQSHVAQCCVHLKLAL